MSTMNSIEEAEVPLAIQKSIRDPDIFTEIAEFEAKLKEKHGKKAIADVIKFNEQEKDKRYERLVNERDYLVRGFTLMTIGWFVYAIHLQLCLDGHKYPLLAFTSSLFHFLAVCTFSFALYRDYYSQCCK